MKLFGIVGWKNTGKTGLTERLVSEFSARGLTVSTIKHAHHAVDIDQRGTDSFRHRAAGASEVLLSSGGRWVLMHELRGEAEPDLATLLKRLSLVDLVLVEGFKSERHAKIETHRGAAGSDLLAHTDPTIRAVASDVPIEIDQPVFDLDDTSAIADFILTEVSK